MSFFRGLTRKKLFSSASGDRRKKEQDYYLQHGSAVLEELLALCDGNCRIPIRYFSAIEIENATKHTEEKKSVSGGYMVRCSLDNRLVLIRFSLYSSGVHRDIAVTAQMSHLKNVLRLRGCCLEFESPVMVYEFVSVMFLGDLFFRERNFNLSWGRRLRIANEVASVVVFLHTEFPTPIIHRDISPWKVIIDLNGVAKIVDFSSSISLPPGELEAEDDALFGTIGYMDPEYAISGIATQKIDVYSFGVLLLELLAGDTAYSIMYRVKSAIQEEVIDLENLPTNIIDHYSKEGNIMDIVDPAILDECGIEIRQQFEDIFDLVKRCLSSKGEDRPYMIHVARELRRIEKCFHGMDRVDSAISEETIYFDIEEDNAMDRVDSALSKATIDFEEDAESNIEEGNAMNGVDSAIMEETIGSKNLPTNLVNPSMEEGNV